MLASCDLEDGGRGIVLGAGLAAFVEGLREGTAGEGRRAGDPVADAAVFVLFLFRFS